MSEHSEPHESLHLTVVEESAKNYQSYLHRGKYRTEKESTVSKLRKVFEKSSKGKQDADLADTLGFN